MLEAAFGPLRPFSNVAGDLVCIKKLLRLRMRAGSFCARACVYASVCLYGCKYVLMRVHMCMHLHMVQKCATVISLTSRCWGGFIRGQKWSRCGLLCVCFLFGFEQEANQRKLLRCGNFTSQGTRNGRSICVCAQASRVHVHVCAHLCVYFGVCMDVCMLICACACAHACKKGCSISSVSLLSSITGHTPEVFMSTLSTQQQHSNNNNNTATTTSDVCPMRRGVREGSASSTDEPEKNTCDD